MAKITERNTKAVILKALREAEKKIAELEKGKLDAEAKVAVKKKTETVKKADQLMEKNIEDQITELSKSITGLLTKINEDLVTQTQNLQTVKEAIALKEKELNELFEIEKQAHTLAGLVNAHQELKLAQEEELAEAKEKAASELAEINDQIQKAREEYETILKEQKEQLAQMKQREEEEFQYNFARHKQKSYDELEDELSNKRKTFNEEVEKTKKALEEEKKAIEQRLKEVTEREKKMDELQAEVDALPDKIAEIESEAKSQANAEIKRKLSIRENTMKKEIEADKRILEKERDQLQSQLDAANETISTLQTKLDEAYKRIQEMGIQMVSSSNEAKAFDKIAALVSDKNKKEN